mmetsp:Transcript_23806/g.36165  ORF Transcript_23806/g.36165 Transcript_23806/m.36165 type:complete len:149 (-) Transcript_23806:884-1330(-)
MSRSGKMPNIYKQWSLEEDCTLFENCYESVPELAATLGRGLKGVEIRLSTLKNATSPAYARLTSQRSKRVIPNDQVKKLIPACEVMRRVRWNQSLLLSDFSIGCYEEDLLEHPLDRPNDSADEIFNSRTSNVFHQMQTENCMGLGKSG